MILTSEYCAMLALIMLGYETQQSLMLHELINKVNVRSFRR